jgi:hypothetical protein
MSKEPETKYPLGVMPPYEPPPRLRRKIRIRLSQEMREAIRNNPDDVRLVVGCSDGTSRIERVQNCRFED